jgi:hypothetical protein
LRWGNGQLCPTPGSAHCRVEYGLNQGERREEGVRENVQEK